MRITNHKQNGVALMAAIFLVVVIGLAVVVMSVLATRNTQQNTQSLLQMRAQSAAAAGLEYAVQQLVETGTCSNIASLTVPALTNFSVSLTCISSKHHRPPNQITLFELSAVAEYGSETEADYVWTELTSTVEL
jgi:Tfp pilus assembly protein PilX